MVVLRRLPALVATAIIILATTNAFSPSHRAFIGAGPTLFPSRRPPIRSEEPWLPRLRLVTPISSLNALAQHAGEAISLFNNMKTPASIIAGAIVPLGFLSPIQLKSEPNDTALEKRVRKLYYLLSVVTLATELVAVMWATVATNGLTERAIAPAESVWHLLKRDFELEWAAVNAHFVVGMLGFLGMIGTRAYFMAQKGLLGRSVLGIALSGLGLMVSIVNRGVAAGGGPATTATGTTAMRYGSNVLALGKRYASLLLCRAWNAATFGPMEILSVTLFLVSVGGALKAVWMDPEEGAK